MVDAVVPKFMINNVLRGNRCLDLQGLVKAGGIECLRHVYCEKINERILQTNLTWLKLIVAVIFVDSLQLEVSNFIDPIFTSGWRSSLNLYVTSCGCVIRNLEG